MNKLGWASDTHLDHVSPAGLRLFIEEIKAENPDGIFLTGDIATAKTLEYNLTALSQVCPVYFVLGNHDYWGCSFSKTRHQIKQLCNSNKNLHYLRSNRPIKLNDNIVLTGVDSWYDAACGHVDPPKLEMNDWNLIEDFRTSHPFKSKFGSTAFLLRIKKIAETEVNRARQKLNTALSHNPKAIIFLTHVPPWRESSRQPNGDMSDNVWAPWFTCLSMGRMLEETAKKYKDVNFTVLCGHSHTAYVNRLTDNLVCRTAGAEYGKPEINNIIYLDNLTFVEKI